MIIVLAQVNATNGNIAKNLANCLYDYQEACSKNADLIVFPELSLSGYLIKDLAFSGEFLREIDSALIRLAEETIKQSCAIIVGCPVLRDNKILNAAILIRNGIIEKEIYKRNLPNYDVFEEPRIFSIEDKWQGPVLIKGKSIGILICEDLWHERPAVSLLEKGAELLIVINASPFDIKKQDKRAHIIKNIYNITRLPILYVNRVGADDHLIFDGGSLAYNSHQIIYSRYWEEALIYFEFNNNIIALEQDQYVRQDPKIYYLSNIYNALVIGTGEYLRKNGYRKVVLGLSGGIDSALVATIAVDVLGPQNVHCLIMPSRFSSENSIKDAKQLVENLSCHASYIPIDNLLDNFLSVLSPVFDNKIRDVTEENIQARIRAVLLMAFSNKNNALLLSTSNKSEAAVGYTTLYGDMSGGLAPISDIYKTQVYDLVRWRNANVPKSSSYKHRNLIPESIIIKAPSAELNYNQKDQDLLPPYDILDDILYCLIEKEMDCQEIADRTGFDILLIHQVYSLLIKSEYKRNQAPVGLKINSRALSYDRKYPVTLRR